MVVFDREQSGAKELAEGGYNLHVVLQLRPTLEFYARAGKITETERDKVFDYLAAPLGK